MGKATKIMRRSIFLFLQNLQHFTSTPSLLAFPFALSALLSLPLVSSSYLFTLLHGRLRSVFLAAGFPPSSDLFSVLNLKLTQTLLSSLFILPFALSFLLLAKASVIRTLFRHSNKAANNDNENSSIFSWISILNPLLVTQFCNTLVVLSANATCFCLLIVSFDVFDVLGFSSSPKALLVLSATGAVVYSIVLAHAYIVCNLSLIISGVEKRNGGFDSILKGCVLMRGRTGTALSLAVPMNMALAGVDALFQYRIVRIYGRSMDLNPPIMLEAMLIAYLYAMLIVLDTIVFCVFLKSCKTGYNVDRIEVHEERDEKCFFGEEKALESLL